MVSLRFRYVVEDVDRHGNVRLYFRRKGQPKVRLPGVPGSDEFAKAYQSALKGAVSLPRKELAPTHGHPVGVLRVFVRPIMVLRSSSFWNRERRASADQSWMTSVVSTD